jgi:hypothetical protein
LSKLWREWATPGTVGPEQALDRAQADGVLFGQLTGGCARPVLLDDGRDAVEGQTFGSGTAAVAGDVGLRQVPVRLPDRFLRCAAAR